MTEARDDPREVLALLNSLGFVGITAPQLKAFMKDLKMYRKIKERERQQWKEDTKKKILSKQENMLDEMLRDTIAGKRSESLENIPPSGKLSCQEDPLVRIKVHCVSGNDENDYTDNETRQNIRVSAPKRQVHAKIDKLDKKKESEITKVRAIPSEGSSSWQKQERSKSYERSKLAELSTDSSQYVSIERRKNSPRKGPQKEAEQVHQSRSILRPLSAPEFTKSTVIPKERSKSVVSDPTGLANLRNNPSRCSIRSHTKSFIRPWRLQPEVQRAASARKSDPVALYQKYRQEWKQISFPGEEQHARIRWAIREKMLGTDPNPRPILKKSQSLVSFKKR